MIWSKGIAVLLAVSSLGQTVFARPGKTAASRSHTLQTITARIAYDLHSEVPDETKLYHHTVQLEKSLQADGAFRDIDYKDQNRSVWLPAGHLRNILDMAMALTSAHDPLFRNKTLQHEISKALAFWNQQDLKCPNWWFNEINCPQLIGEILIILQNSKVPLDKQLREGLIQKMKRGNMYQQEGANKVDVAIHTLYRSLLTSDTSLLNAAVEQCFLPIQLTTKEGVQYDYSYFQHGPQLQIAAYGLTFLSAAYKVASYVRDTKWALPEEKKQLLNTFFNTVFLKTIRGKYEDFNATGRRFVRKDILDMRRPIDMHATSNLLQNALLVNPSDSSYYHLVYQKIYEDLPAGIKTRPAYLSFRDGDYALDIRPDFLVSLRTNSTRTCRVETVNEENLLGRYMGDGVTDILRRGDEYYNIFPLWEWDKVPGITMRDHRTDWPLQPHWPTPQGTTDFVGGVTDSLDGISVYQLDYDSLQAKKAYFSFDNAVICLGAGINSSAPDSITTAVNQCWLHGPVFSSIDSGQQPLPEHAENRLALHGASNWVWHDSIGYVFPMGGQLIVDTRMQKGNWHAINHVYPGNDTCEGYLFKTWLQHGDKPKSSKYAYIIIPAITKAAMQQTPGKDIRIVDNSGQRQAVYTSAGKKLGIVFYQPDTLRFQGTTIQTDAACLLMIKHFGEKKQAIYVSDPTHKLTQIQLSINGRKFNVALPSGHDAGGTVRLG